MENKHRRRFIKESIAAATGMSMIPVFSSCSSENADLSQMFVHHVFFWLKEPENKEAMDSLRLGLQRLVTIETIRYTHIGVPADTNREVIDSSYQFSLLLIFENKEGQDIYQEHEKHKTFIADCSDLWEKVLVYDSWNG